MKKRLVIATLLIFFMAGVFVASAKSPEAPRMTKDQLKAMLGSHDLIIVDVRTESGWAEGDLKIKGAVREDPGAVESWAKNYPKDKTLVFYCS